MDNKLIYNIGLTLYFMVLVLGCADKGEKPDHHQFVDPIHIYVEELDVQDTENETLLVRWEFPVACRKIDLGPIEPNQIDWTNADNASAISSSMTSSTNFWVNANIKSAHWKIVTPSVRFSLEKYDNERNRLFLIADQDITRFEIQIRPGARGQGSSYRALYPYGEKGLVFYTGAFWPFDEDNIRSHVVFDFKGGREKQIIAFDRAEKMLLDWQSPFNHPAFVYLGEPVRGVEKQITATDKIASGKNNIQANFQDGALILDRKLPDWIEDHYQTFIPPVLAWLEGQFDLEKRVDDQNQTEQQFSPIKKHKMKGPNLFVNAGAISNIEKSTNARALQTVDDEPPAGFVFAGDALPGQVMMTLAGQAWARPSEAGSDILYRATTHELVHLWQTRARPETRDVPSWIHEGAADAITGEALLALGFWDRERKENFDRAAERNCRKSLAGRRLQDLERAMQQGEIPLRDVYACGHILAMIGAGGHSRGDLGVLGFWRELINDKQILEKGYSLESWLSLVETRARNRKIGPAVRLFVVTSWHEPRAELKRLMNLAGEEEQSAPIGR